RRRPADRGPAVTTAVRDWAAAVRAHRARRRRMVASAPRVILSAASAAEQMRRIPMRERGDWKRQAEEVGFVYHTQKDGRPYWNERAAYEFSLFQIEEHIEKAAAELETLCLQFVGEAVNDEAILASLEIPKFAWDTIRESWERGDRNLYGRFDFAYDGTS